MSEEHAMRQAASTHWNFGSPQSLLGGYQQDHAAGKVLADWYDEHENPRAAIFFRNLVHSHWPSMKGMARGGHSEAEWHGDHGVYHAWSKGEHHMPSLIGPGMMRIRPVYHTHPDTGAITMGLVVEHRAPDMGVHTPPDHAALLHADDARAFFTARGHGGFRVDKPPENPVKLAAIEAPGAPGQSVIVKVPVPQPVNTPAAPAPIKEPTPSAPAPKPQSPATGPVWILPQ